jgi:hypothetical protein
MLILIDRRRLQTFENIEFIEREERDGTRRVDREETKQGEAEGETENSDGGTGFGGRS